MGRVLATCYGEVVTDRLFEGKAQLTEAFQPLVLATERTLGLDEAKRSRTLLRVDAGGGSLQDVNWALARGYQFLGKEYSGRRARRLAASASPRGSMTLTSLVGRSAGCRNRPQNTFVTSCVLRFVVANRMGSGGSVS